MEPNESNIEILLKDKEGLENQLKVCQKEQNRLRYMASGYSALLLETGNAELIKRANEIADEADKLE